MGEKLNTDDLLIFGCFVGGGLVWKSWFQVPSVAKFEVVGVVKVWLRQRSGGFCWRFWGWSAL